MSKKKVNIPSNNSFKKGAQKIQNPNPFDLKVNKSKFNVLNKTVVGSRGAPTKAKARSLEVRKKTILPEFIRRGRTGEFYDRRFGEKNSSLSPEEKMLERFSRERLRTSKKKTGFNLNDPDEDYSHTLTLTHRGKSLDNDDALDSDPEESDIESDGGIDENIVSKSHFGGGSNGTATPRTKSEIMQEVISKSKLYKFERQKIKEENAALCDDLDSDFNSILHTLETRDAVKEARPRKDVDDYTESLKLLAFDKRIQPSDRTKTKEELEKEASEKTRKSEEERRKRMYGELDLEPDFEDETESHGEETLEGFESDSSKSLKMISDKINLLLDNILQADNKKVLNSSFLEIASLSRTNSVIPVARVLRERLSTIAKSIDRRVEKGFAPIMPNRDSLLIFHMIGVIFSTSDYHHIVVTPAQLLMATYLESGRILKKSHLVSALFMIQTLLKYQAESQRICPELFSLLYPLARLSLGVKSSDQIYPNDRFMSKSIHEFLTTGSTDCGAKQMRPIKFADLVSSTRGGDDDDDDDGETLSKSQLVGFIKYLINQLFNTYKSNIAAPEILSPFVNLLSVEDLIVELDEIRRKRTPLLRKVKPIAIPQLNPAIDQGPTRQERESRHLQHTYKRELKGAKRELKRDSAFLAQQKLNMKIEADKKYQAKLRHIMGSISNEGASTEAKIKRRK